MTFRVGQTVRHPDHGDWTVTWVRKDHVVMYQRGTMRVLRGCRVLREWIVVDGFC